MLLSKFPTSSGRSPSRLGHGASTKVTVTLFPALVHARFVTASEYDTSKVLSTIQDMPADGLSSELVIGEADMVGGGIYYLTVEVSNFVGSKATAQVVTTKSTEPVPIVSIDGPSTVYSTAGATLELSALAKLPRSKCAGSDEEQKVGNQITYQWSVISGPRIDMTKGTVGRTAASPTLYLGPHSLQFGATYTFQVDSKLRVAEFRKAIDTVTVVVGYDDIDDVTIRAPSTRPGGSALSLSAGCSTATPKKAVSWSLAPLMAHLPRRRGRLTQAASSASAVSSPACAMPSV